MKISDVNLLRQEVEKSFGRKILSSTDCRYLCHDIYHQVKVKLSFNTLRRFFNLMEANTRQASFYTLDILSNYCGFPSFSNFITVNRQGTDGPSGSEESDLLDYLVLLFKNTEVNSIIDITYFNLVQQTINFLEHHPYVIDKFQRKIAKTKNGQEFYFEQFIHLDRLNSFYGAGLHYYLNEKKTKEAQIFGHSILCLRSFLSMNDEGVEQQYKPIAQYANDKLDHPSLYGRFLSAQLYHAYVVGADPGRILAKARQVCYFLNGSSNCHSYFSFEIVLSEALILTHQYEEATFYIDEYMKKRKKFIQSFIDMQLGETIPLFQAIVLANTGKATKAKKVMHDINPNRFYFLSKQCHTMLYLLLKQQLYKKDFEQEQMRFLAQTTGFKRLLNRVAVPVSVGV